MLSPVEYQRLGAVFVPDLNLYSFFKNGVGTLPDATFVLFVEPREFYERWYHNSDKPRPGSPPGPFSEWPPYQQREFILSFIKGPRQPLPLPYVSHGQEDINVLPGRLIMQALLDWHSENIPVTVSDHTVNELQKTVGAKLLAPVPGKRYLADAHRVLSAFEARIPIAQLYKDDVPKLKDSKELKAKMMRGVQDYAHLIHFQLEVMVVRLLALQNSADPVLVDLEKRGMHEMRRLLHQRNVVSHWFAKSGDLNALPNWDPAEMASDQDGREYFKQNAIQIKYRGKMPPLQTVSSLADSEITASRPTEKRKGHLRLATTEND